MIRRNTVGVSNQSLNSEIKHLGTTSIENIRKLYVDIGVDIYEGRKPSIKKNSM